MELLLADMPSGGYKSGLPDVLSMKEFSGPSLNHIGKAIETSSMLPLFDALSYVAKFDVNMLSIPDAMYLLYRQRTELNTISQLRAVGKCRHPVFEHADGTHVYRLDDRRGPIVHTRPCDSHLILDLHKDTPVIKLGAVHEEYSLPRVHHLRASEAETLSAVDWVACHLDEPYSECVSLLESQSDLSLWLKLSAWAQRARHGLPREILGTCPECARQSNVNWSLVPQMFLV
jgi:hypothetical protein